MIHELMKILERLFLGKRSENEAQVRKERAGKPAQVAMLQHLEEYLTETYDFRFNVLTEQVEYRRKEEQPVVPCNADDLICRMDNIAFVNDFHTVKTKSQKL